jgi:GWxTD domain-containing protein
MLTSTFDAEVRAYGFRLDLSDIMFTVDHRQAASLGFTRNGVDAAPNPRHEMIGTDPSISVYVECYQALANHVDTMAIKFEVLDYVKRNVMTSYSKLIGSSNGLVIREDIPAGALQTGVYTLIISALSQDVTAEFATREERFYILNPELPPSGSIMLTEEQQFMNSQWAVLGGEQLQLEIELSDVLASKAEKIILEGLQDDRAKQRYLYRFWQLRDPDPTTAANERLDEFRKMFDRAQGFYSSAVFRDGWRTDRGRTLLKYGVPTQVVQHIQELDTKPYEEWFYQGIQGGVYFYFVDIELMQNHRLVHSTMIGEVRNEKWFDLYAKAFQPDPNPTRSLLPTAR